MVWTLTKFRPRILIQQGVPLRLSVKSRVVLGFVLILTSTLAAAQSDETGTLAMAARTPSTVVIAIDSAVTHENRESQPETVSIHNDRKLIDVGETSACAII